MSSDNESHVGIGLCLVSLNCSSTGPGLNIIISYVPSSVLSSHFYLQLVNYFENLNDVENYDKYSLCSVCQDSGLPSSMGPVKVQQDDCLELKDSDQSNPKEEDSPQSIVEGYEGDEDSSFYQLSEALTNHFYYSNGVLRPKLHSNAILLHSRAQII